MAVLVAPVYVSEHDPELLEVRRRSYSLSPPTAMGVVVQDCP
jgi:hypothetical protein